MADFGNRPGTQSLPLKSKIEFRRLQLQHCDEFSKFHILIANEWVGVVRFGRLDVSYNSMNSYWHLQLVRVLVNTKLVTTNCHECRTVMKTNGLGFSILKTHPCTAP